MSHPTLLFILLAVLYQPKVLKTEAEKATPVFAVAAAPVAATSIQSSGNVAVAIKEPIVAVSTSGNESGPRQAGARRSTERKRKKSTAPESSSSSSSSPDSAPEDAAEKEETQN